MAVRALVAVDIQYDFLPGGSLAVPSGHEVTPVLNDLMTRFDVVVATQDWHPADHASFASNHPGHEVGDMVTLGGVEQVLWPDHCVQLSRGAELSASLNQRAVAAIIRKGRSPEVDSYSAFFDNAHLRLTGLEGYLRGHQVDEVWFGGLATDYCVLYSVLDAAGLDFATVVVRDACRGIDLSPGDVDRAFDEMAAAGARIATSADA